MATKVAIEVDVKTGDASDEIISLREELEKVKAARETNRPNEDWL